MPSLSNTGTMWGDRVCWMSNKICVVEEKKLVKGFIDMGKTIKQGKFAGKDKKDTFKGQIYKFIKGKAKNWMLNQK